MGGNKLKERRAFLKWAGGAILGLAAGSSPGCQLLEKLAEPEAAGKGEGQPVDGEERGIVYIGSRDLDGIINNVVEPEHFAEIMQWDYHPRQDRGHKIYVVDASSQRSFQELSGPIQAHEQASNPTVEINPYKQAFLAYTHRIDSVANFFSSVGQPPEVQQALMDALVGKEIIIPQDGRYLFSEYSALVMVHQGLSRQHRRDCGGAPRTLMLFHELIHAYAFLDRPFYDRLLAFWEQVEPEAKEFLHRVVGKRHDLSALGETAAYLLEEVLHPPAVAHLRLLQEEAIQRRADAVAAAYVERHAPLFSDVAVGAHQDFFSRHAQLLYESVKETLPPELRERARGFESYIKD